MVGLLFYLFIFEKRYHASQSSLEISYIAEDGLKLLIFLPPPPKCYDYRSISVYVVLGSKPQAW